MVLHLERALSGIYKQASVTRTMLILHSINVKFKITIE